MPVWVNPVSVLTGEYCCILARRRAFTFPETPLGSSSTDSIWSLIFQLASLPPLGFLCLNSLLDIVPRQNVVTGTIQCLSSKSHRSHLWFPYYVFCFFSPHWYNGKGGTKWQMFHFHFWHLLSHSGWESWFCFQFPPEWLCARHERLLKPFVLMFHITF